MTPAEITAEMLRLSGLLDQALRYQLTKAREYAERENAYRMAHAKAFLNAEGAQGDKKARADLDTGDERYQAHLADGEHKAAIEAVRSRRAQLSALQSVANMVRDEAQLAKYGPQVDP